MGIDLTKPLPPEVLAAKPGKRVPYRNFAVFSWPWLKRRSQWMAFWIALVLTVVAVSMIGDQPSLGDAIAIHGLITVKALLLVGCGPLLATTARQRLVAAGRNPRDEMRGTLLTLLVGMLGGVAVVYAMVDTPRQQLAYKVIGESPKMSATVKAEIAVRAAQYPITDKYTDLAANLVVSFLWGGGLAALAYRREHQRIKDLARDRELAQVQAEKREMDTKLAVLQAQVEPHFLFNTLASVRALIKQDPDRAQSMVDALVSYLRATIPQMREERGPNVVSTLAQQIALATAYLELMCVRMGQRLTFSVEVPADLRAHAFPPLLLISLVENAVKHGAEPNAKPTHIALVARQSPSSLHVAVVDSGVGMQAAATRGMGLANLRAQLQARFGDRASLTLENVATGGVSASISVPLSASGEST